MFLLFLGSCSLAGYPGEYPEKQADLHRDSGCCRDEHGPGEIPRGQTDYCSSSIQHLTNREDKQTKIIK